MLIIEKGQYPDLLITFLSTACHHCIEPACVSACSMHAMDAGPIEQLIAKYGDIREAEGFVYSKKLVPSVLFKTKKDTEGSCPSKVEIAPDPLT